MGATLADGGVNPVTHERVVAAEVCHYVLAVMLTAGMYESSGEWRYHVGLPARSGIGGGIVTVSPGKGGLGTFAPRLDAAGNSVKGTLAARHLSAALGMGVLISRRRPRRPGSLERQYSTILEEGRALGGSPPDDAELRPAPMPPGAGRARPSGASTIGLGGCGHRPRPRPLAWPCGDGSR